MQHQVCVRFVFIISTDKWYYYYYYCYYCRANYTTGTIKRILEIHYGIGIQYGSRSKRRRYICHIIRMFIGIVIDDGLLLCRSDQSRLQSYAVDRCADRIRSVAVSSQECQQKRDNGTNTRSANSPSFYSNNNNAHTHTHNIYIHIYRYDEPGHNPFPPISYL